MHAAVVSEVCSADCVVVQLNGPERLLPLCPEHSGGHSISFTQCAPSCCIHSWGALSHADSMLLFVPAATLLAQCFIPCASVVLPSFLSTTNCSLHRGLNHAPKNRGLCVEALLCWVAFTLHSQLCLLACQHCQQEWVCARADICACAVLFGSCNRRRSSSRHQTAYDCFLVGEAVQCACGWRTGFGGWGTHEESLHALVCGTPAATFAPGFLAMYVSVWPNLLWLNACPTLCCCCIGAAALAVRLLL